jgi:diguanylate cyclase (GGDEF)-like protein
LLAEALRIGAVETEGWRLTRSGSRLWANSVITALPDEAGAVRGFVVVSRDMTERKRLENDMRRLAAVDGLTGAYNRRHGELLLAAEFSRRARGGLPFAVLMLDVDHFKAINDRFGHAAGDVVLQALTQTCAHAMRPVDIVVRWGGEEFLVILPATDEAGAMSAAERLRATLAATQVANDGDGPISFTVSIGVALSRGQDPADLLRRCDVAMYAAKAGGRDRVMLAT